MTIVPRRLRLSDRNPFEIYLVLGGLVSNVPVAFGATPTSNVLRDTLDPAGARMWSVVLSVGCLVTLVGLAWRRPRSDDRVSVTGLALEQIGMTIIAAATPIYAYAAVARSGLGALFASLVVLSFGLAAGVQAWKIRTLLNYLASRES